MVQRAAVLEPQIVEESSLALILANFPLVLVVPNFQVEGQQLRKVDIGDDSLVEEEVE